MNRLRLFAHHDTKRVFKNACARFDLVYFGHVSQYSDDHQMVRGFTLSPSHVDRHYCVGTVSGIDVILLERMDTISFPDKPSKAYTWTILRVDLRRNLHIHFLLNSHRYDDLVYAHLFTAFHDYRQYRSQGFAGHSDMFTSTFRVYAPPQHIDDVLALLRPDITETLAHHFSTLDYEIAGDQLLVYAPTASPTDHTIELMFKAGIWLATQLDPGLIHSVETQTDDSTPPSH